MPLLEHRYGNRMTAEERVARLSPRARFPHPMRFQAPGSSGPELGRKETENASGVCRGSTGMFVLWDCLRAIREWGTKICGNRVAWPAALSGGEFSIFASSFGKVSPILLRTECCRDPVSPTDKHSGSLFSRPAPSVLGWVNGDYFRFCFSYSSFRMARLRKCKKEESFISWRISQKKNKSCKYHGFMTKRVLQEFFSCSLSIPDKKWSVGSYRPVPGRTSFTVASLSAVAARQPGTRRFPATSIDSSSDALPSSSVSVMRVGCVTGYPCTDNKNENGRKVQEDPSWMLELTMYQRTWSGRSECCIMSWRFGSVQHGLSIFVKYDSRNGGRCIQ